MPPNHRDLTSAKYLWDNYINWRSFVANGNERQRGVYKLSGVPFGMEDFIQVIDNSYMLDFDNANAKIDFINWNILNDKAEIDYNKKEVFAPNLTETYIQG